MDRFNLLSKCLELAQIAFDKGSVPIGALITDSEGNILAEGFNEIKITKDPTAHAEVVCMRHANEKIIKTINPQPTFLFTTLEPCPACGFFVTRTNIKNIIWALNDPYKGGINILKSDINLAKDFIDIVLTAEPFEELKIKSKSLMRYYYLKKGDQQTADLFI